MAIPAEYDTSGATIEVAPDNVFQTATVGIAAFNEGISDSVNRIVQIWNDLKIGWVGNTAKEAADFNDQWVTEISELFGSAASKTPGLLSKIANGIAKAAMNYGQAEDVVANMFNQTADALASSGSGDSPPSSTDAVRNVEHMPILERN